MKLFFIKPLIKNTKYGHKKKQTHNTALISSHKNPYLFPLPNYFFVKPLTFNINSFGNPLAPPPPAKKVLDTAQKCSLVGLLLWAEIDKALSVVFVLFVFIIKFSLYFYQWNILLCVVLYCFVGYLLLIFATLLHHGLPPLRGVSHSPSIGVSFRAPFVTPRLVHFLYLFFCKYFVVLGPQSRKKNGIIYQPFFESESARRHIINSFLNNLAQLISLVWTF